MKKFAGFIALLALVAFAAPVFAATNPFMDVPLNHWAYDAIGQLAAHGILSGYPDGTYKGKQPTTRYEMASALARALAVVDMTKASKQDVAMLQKLVVEFKDELDALGVKVEDLDSRVAVLEDRLGGWKMSGIVRLDVDYHDYDDGAGKAKGNVNMARARLTLERWFGDPDNPMHFKGVIRGDSGEGKQTSTQNWHTFLVEIPFFYDTKLSVGHFARELELPYYFGGDTWTGVRGDLAGLDDVISDYGYDQILLEKNFALGSAWFSLGHSDLSERSIDGVEKFGNDANAGGYSAWEALLFGRFQFTEQFGFDLAVQYFAGDEAEPKLGDAKEGSIAFDNMWTIMAGLRYDFTNAIALKGTYYHQQVNGDVVASGTGNKLYWQDIDADDANRFQVIVDVKQDLLKFTGAWLEYGQIDKGFIAPVGNGSFSSSGLVKAVAQDDVKYWRLALTQKWASAPKWTSYLFYYGYDFDQIDRSPAEYGLGVGYKLNSNVEMGLNYMHVDGDDKWDDDNQFRFRTQVSF